MEGNLSAPNITKEQLEAKIERAATLQAEIDKNKPIADELKLLKDEIHYGMQALGSRRTDPMAGFYGLRSITESYAIDDPDAVAAWLDENAMDPSAYYTQPQLNLGALKELQTERLRDYGEVIPGLNKVTTESFTLKRAK